MSITPSPPPLARLALDAWKRMPLAKRRLLTDGPLTPGRDAFRLAVVAIAAELRLQGVEQEAAEGICAGMPFTEGATPRRKVVKSVKTWVQWAYHPPDGQPILSGCPRTGRTSGSERSSRLRSTFADHCDTACAQSCPAMRLHAMPELALIGTAYEATLLSRIWMSKKAGGLGPEARQVYAILASIAVVERSEKVHASSGYVCRRLGGEWPAATLRRRLTRLRHHGLIKTLNKHTGLHWIPPLSDEALAALEDTLGVNEAARWNVIEANWDSLRKAELWPTWEPEDEAA